MSQRVSGVKMITTAELRLLTEALERRLKPMFNDITARLDRMESRLSKIEGRLAIKAKEKE